jgi:hypothetical protein
MNCHQQIHATESKMAAASTLIQRFVKLTVLNAYLGIFWILSLQNVFLMFLIARSILPMDNVNYVNIDFIYLTTFAI